jgi:hypothetical protein
MDNNSNNCGVLLDSCQLSLNTSLVLRVSLGVLGEGLLLRSVPILIETTFDFITKMSSPNGSKSTKSTRSWNVTNNSDNNNRGSFNDCNSLYDFLLVDLCLGKREKIELLLDPTLSTSRTMWVIPALYPKKAVK